MLQNNKKNIIPGFGISLGGSLFFASLIILLPISTLIVQLSKITLLQYWSIITNPRIISTYKITFLSASIASIFNAIFGILIAWIITRYKFYGSILLDSLIDIPFVLPTAVAGFTLAGLFSIHGWYGKILSKFNINISYTWIGIVIAMIFTSIPFVVRTIQPVLEEINPECEEAAKILGAMPLKIFHKIIFPKILPSLLIGTVLSFTRSLGEFGAIIFIAGNIAWKTEVTSLMIFVQLQEFNYTAASAIASVILFISLFILLLVNILQNKFSFYFKGI